MKKIISILASLILVTNIMIMNASAVEYGIEYSNQNITRTYKQAFSDVDEDYWAYDYIMEMCDRNVLSGYPNGKFYPDNKITRSEFAKIMTIASGMKIKTAEAKLYEDVEVDEWYAPYIEAAHLYLSGYSINNKYYYKPNDVALREDIAVALVKLKGYSTVGYDESMLKTMFKDSYSISKNAIQYVATAVEEGLVSGYADDTFRGQQGITRAEAATLLWRAYQYGNDNKIFDSDNTIEEKPIDKTPDNNIEINNPTVVEPEKPKEEEKPVKPNVEAISANNISIKTNTPHKIEYQLYPYNAESDIIMRITDETNKDFVLTGDTILAYRPSMCVVMIIDIITGKSVLMRVVAESDGTDTQIPDEDYDDDDDDDDDDEKEDAEDESPKVTIDGISSKYLCDVNEINSRRNNLVPYPNGVLYTDGSAVYSCDSNGNTKVLFDINNFKCGKEENPYKKEHINFYSIAYNYITNEIAVTYSCNHESGLLNLSTGEFIETDFGGKIYGIYNNGDYALASSGGSYGHTCMRVTKNGKFIKLNETLSSDKVFMSKNGQIFFVSENGDKSNIYAANPNIDGKFYSNIDFKGHRFLSYSIGTNMNYSYKDGVVYAINVDDGYGIELFNIKNVISNDGSPMIDMAEGSFVTYDGKNFYYYDHNYSCLRLITIN